MENKPLERLMANFARGNFDVTAEEIFKPESMTISKLIRQLTATMETEGDLPVRVWDPYYDKSDERVGIEVVPEWKKTPPFLLIAVDKGQK